MTTSLANDLARIKEDLRLLPRTRVMGTVRDVLGPVVRAELVGAAIGDTVSILRRDESRLLGRVVGFSGSTVVLSPFGDTRAIAPGAKVTLLSSDPRIPVGEHILGAVVNPFAQPLSNVSSEGLRWTVGEERAFGAHSTPLYRLPPSPLERQPIVRRFETRLRALDGFVPIGCGQRLAIFAEPGVGKSTLMALLASSPAPSIRVFGLIGERGREVAEFLRHLDTLSLRERSIVVVSTSDEPAALRIQAALAATAIAEYFRDQGHEVLLQIDSLTRLMRAYRELGLAAGEPPIRRGYPASVYAALPILLERAGNSAQGGITAFYSVLLSAELDEDPMVEEIKGLTDGHIVLRRELAEAGIFPAIDPLRSVSRLERTLVDPELYQALHRIRSLLGRVREDRELALLNPDAIDPELRTALELHGSVRAFIRQELGEWERYESTRQRLIELARQGTPIS